MLRKVPNLVTRNGVFETRIQIPADVRDAYGKTVEQVSHKTRDYALAMGRHDAFAKDVKKRIDALRAGEPAPELIAEKAPVLWSPDDAFAAIQAWAKARIDASYLAHFHGTAPAYSPFGDEAAEASRLAYALQQGRWQDIADLDAQLFAALPGFGLTEAHPALPDLRRWFGETLREVVAHEARFRRRDFSEWTLKASLQAKGASLTGDASDKASDAATTLSGLLDRFVGRFLPSPKDESELRGYVRRLIEHLGDVPIRDIGPADFDRFLVRLRKFPTTRRPDILRRSFDEIVDRYGDDEALPKLANKTIRAKWFGGYKRLFDYALSLKIVTENPVTMPSKKDDVTVDRDPWRPDQIAAMFAKPLFTGATELRAYRETPGGKVGFDAKFWLPVIALWSGMRLDEIGAMRTDELKCEDDIWFFDLRGRPAAKGPRHLKNEQSCRIVPVHPKLIELGLIRYAKAQGEWLFPDLPQNTAQISKWFGLWRAANKVADPELVQDFHSYRHNFKDACRVARIAEDINDKLTGHAGTANQRTARGYGAKDGDLRLLSEEMAKVDYPTFPKVAAYPQ